MGVKTIVPNGMKNTFKFQFLNTSIVLTSPSHAAKWIKTYLEKGFAQGLFNANIIKEMADKLRSRSSLSLYNAFVKSMIDTTFLIAFDKNDKIAFDKNDKNTPISTRLSAIDFFPTLDKICTLNESQARELMELFTSPKKRIAAASLQSITTMLHSATLGGNNRSHTLVPDELFPIIDRLAKRKDDVGIAARALLDATPPKRKIKMSPPYTEEQIIQPGDKIRFPLSKLPPLNITFLPWEAVLQDQLRPEDAALFACVEKSKRIIAVTLGEGKSIKLFPQELYENPFYSIYHGLKRIIITAGPEALTVQIKPLPGAQLGT